MLTGCECGKYITGSNIGKLHYKECFRIDAGGNPGEVTFGRALVAFAV